jgi:hypothetical protein
LVATYGETDLRRFAGIEWKDRLESNGEAPMSGALKCMCKEDIKAGGVFGIYNVRNKEYNFTATDGTEIVNKKLCK